MELSFSSGEVGLPSSFHMDVAFSSRYSVLYKLRPMCSFCGGTHCIGVVQEVEHIDLTYSRLYIRG